MLLKKVSILGGEIYNMSKSFAHHIPAKPGSDLIRTVLLWYTHKVCKIPLVIRISWQTADYNNTHTYVYKYINRNYQHLFNFSKKTFFIYQTILTQTMRQKDIQIKLDTHTHTCMTKLVWSLSCVFSFTVNWVVTHRFSLSRLFFPLEWSDRGMIVWTGGFPLRR